MSDSTTKQEQLKSLMHYLIVILVALILSYFIIVLFHPVIVSGNSMEPTLNNGSIMISTNSFSEKTLGRGDVIVFKENKMQMIKRIIAVAGDEIWIENGQVYVNGMLSPYQYEYIQNPGILEEHFFVRNGEYFCMGDNRNNSYDCREFGSISFSQIKYKIIKQAFKKGKEQ